MKMKLPDIIFGQKVNGAYERYLAGAKKKPRKKSPQIPSNIENPENYIILEGRTHGSYSYPDLIVSMHRLGYDANVESAAKSLGLTLKNTATEKDGTEYIGNINWEQALKLNLNLGNITLNPRQYVDFINLLKSGEAYNALGKLIDKIRLDAILDEILTVRDPYRAEWLDAKFSKKGKNWNITYHKINNRALEEVTEPLEDCLMKDRGPGIDLDYWLKNATKQGIPKEDTPDGKLYYWSPRNGAVAGFDAGSDWAGLVCYGNPGCSYSSLGVRRAKIKG